MFSARSDFGRSKNRLELARAAAVSAGKAILDLTESNPTRAGLPCLELALDALADRRGLSYQPDPFGLSSAREAVCAFMADHGLTVTPERVVLTSSTSEAYAFLFKLLCDPHDQALVPSPSYPLFEHLAQLENVRATSYPLAYDGRWHLPGDALVSARTRDARAVVAVHPNNPTGSYLKQAELAALCSLGLPLISDEVFAPYAFGKDPSRVASALAADAGLVFTLHGLSKLAALPQLKLSWICIGGPDTVVNEARNRLELIADSYLSVATPVQLALPAILAAHAPVTAAVHTRLERNLRVLHELTAGTAVTPLYVEGGWYAPLRLPDLRDDEAWALMLLQTESVLLQPGYFYGFDGPPHVVLSLLTEEPTFREGVSRLVAGVNRLV